MNFSAVNHQKNTFSCFKGIILLFFFPLFSNFLYGQQKHIADELVKEGIYLQDKGQVDLRLVKIYPGAGTRQGQSSRIM